MADLESEGETGIDRAYEWTVRVLYAALIAGNLLIAWDAWKDTPSGIELRAKVRARVTRVKDCADCRRRKAWLRDRAHMLWQATEIVEDAKEGKQ